MSAARSVTPAFHRPKIFGDIMKAKSWKQVVRVADLADNQKLEATCKTCGHVHYLTKALICVSEEREFLFIDEIERETICRARGCRGQVRLAMVRLDEMSGFIGGLA